jgi:hypothetical protein
MQTTIVNQNNKPEVGRRENLIAFAILVFVLVTFYRDVVFNGRTFLMEGMAPGTLPNGPYNYTGIIPNQFPLDPGAIAWNYEPFNKFISESVKKGDFPVWNPYSGLAGAPIFADGVNGPLEPIQFLFYFVPDQFWPYAVDIQLLVRFLFAGFFCYLFARRLKVGLLGAVTAGIVFMLSSYFVGYGNHPQAKPELLLPFVLYGYDRLADLKDQRGLWIGALAIGWVIVAAMPESTFFVLLLGNLWFFYKALFNILENDRKKKQTGVTVLLRYFAATLAGFLLAAVYLMPFIEYLFNAASAHAPGTGLNVFYPWWSLPGALLQIYHPYLTGLVQNHLGFFPLLLGILVLLNAKRTPYFRRDIYFFALYVFFSLLIIYDFPLTQWVAKLPVFSQLVISKYAVPSIMFCLAMLAGLAVHTMAKEGFSARTLPVSIALAVCIFIILPFLSDPDKSLSCYADTGMTVLALTTLFFSIFTLLLFRLMVLAERQKSSIQRLQIALVFLICFEPYFWAAGLQKPNRADPYQPPPFVQFLKSQPEPYRIFSADGFLYPNVSSAYQIADIRWLNGLIYKRTYEFSTHLLAPEAEVMRFNGSEKPVSRQMFNRLNVRYIVSGTPVDNAGRLVYQGADALIYENEAALSRAWVVYQVKNVNDFGAALRFLADASGAESGQTAVVENIPENLANAINQNKSDVTPVAGQFRQIKSGQAEVEVTSTNPGLLIVSEQYSPDWRAEIDGAETPVYAVDGIFRGVYIPAGQHKVIFTYEPMSLKVGSGLSLFALVVIVYFLSRSKRLSANASNPSILEKSTHESENIAL